ncbi:MAG: rhodanese-like domain-containing protein [Nannocystaceae bacterium]
MTRAVRELLTLGALATALGLLSVGLRTDLLPWIADPTADLQSCTTSPDEEVETADAQPRVERIAVAAALAMLERSGEVTFVDARSPDQYAIGHIPGAISLPADQAEAIVAVTSIVPQGGTVIAYCEGLTCERSESLGQLLRDTVGCQNVLVLDGGFARWIESGAPIEQGSGASHG